MANLSIIFQGVFAVLNANLSPAPQIASLDFGNPTMAATVFNYDGYVQAAIGGGTAIVLPATKISLIAVQNISPTTNLVVSHTPFSGTGVSSTTYGPNGVCVLFDPAETTNGGFTALTVAGVGSICPCAILLGV